MEKIFEFGPVALWLGTVFPAALALTGSILAVCGVFDVFRTMRIRRRPAADGVVVAAEILKPHKSGHKPWITYRFSVGGRGYESSYFFHGQQHLGHKLSKAQRMIAPYPPGTPVRVLYDPANPRVSVVVVRSLIWIYITGAMIFWVSALLFAAIIWTVEIFSKR